MKRILAFSGLGISIAGLVVVLARVIPSVQSEPSVAEIRPVKVTITESELEDLRYNRETLDLAVEFGFNPLIVSTVRANASRILDGGDPVTWRFIPNEEFLSYLFLSLIQVESGGNPGAVGDNRTSFGLSQLQMPTARAYKEDVTENDLLTIGTHLDIAFMHFAHLMETYNGNFALAVITWNRGETAVNRAIALGSSPANGYAHRVFTVAVYPRVYQ